MESDSSEDDHEARSRQVMEYYKKYASNRGLNKYFTGTALSYMPQIVQDEDVDETNTVTVVPEQGDEILKPVSPASSGTSTRKLEWDSGADIGYKNCIKIKKSSSLPTILQEGKQLPHIVITDSENLLLSTSSSSPEIKCTISLSSSSSSEISPDKPLRPVSSSTSTELSKKESVIDNDTIDLIKKMIGTPDAESTPKVDLRRVMTLVSTKPILVECLHNRACEGANQKVQSSTTPDQSTKCVQTGDSLGQVSEPEIQPILHNQSIIIINEDGSHQSPLNNENSTSVSSFEYFPPKSSSSDNPVLAEVISKKQSSTLAGDVDKNFELLQRLIKSKKYNEATKKRYIKKIVAKMIDSKYADDSTTSSELFVPKPRSLNKFTVKTFSDQFLPQESSSSYNSWKDGKTNSERILEGRQKGQGDELLRFASKERQHQLSWISGEISHLTKLKSLLEKNGQKTTSVYMVSNQLGAGGSKEPPRNYVIETDLSGSSSSSQFTLKERGQVKHYEVKEIGKDSQRIVGDIEVVSDDQNTNIRVKARTATFVPKQPALIGNGRYGTYPRTKSDKQQSLANECKKECQASCAGATAFSMEIPLDESTASLTRRVHELLERYKRRSCAGVCLPACQHPYCSYSKEHKRDVCRRPNSTSACTCCVCNKYNVHEIHDHGCAHQHSANFELLCQTRKNNCNNVCKGASNTQARDLPEEEAPGSNLLSIRTHKGRLVDSFDTDMTQKKTSEASSGEKPYSLAQKKIPEAVSSQKSMGTGRNSTSSGRTINDFIEIEELDIASEPTIEINLRNKESEVRKNKLPEAYSGKVINTGSSSSCSHSSTISSRGSKDVINYDEGNVGNQGGVPKESDRSEEKRSGATWTENMTASKYCQCGSRQRNIATGTTNEITEDFGKLYKKSLSTGKRASKSCQCMTKSSMGSSLRTASTPSRICTNVEQPCCSHKGVQCTKSSERTSRRSSESVLETTEFIVFDGTQTNLQARPVYNSTMVPESGASVSKPTKDMSCQKNYRTVDDKGVGTLNNEDKAVQCECNAACQTAESFSNEQSDASNNENLDEKSSGTRTTSSSATSTSETSSVQSCVCCKQRNMETQNLYDLKKKLSLCRPCYKQSKVASYSAATYRSPTHVCNCHTVIQTDTLNQIKRTISDIRKLDEHCTCVNGKLKSICPYCKQKLHKTSKSRNGIAYLLTFETEAMQEAAKTPRKKKRSLEEIKIKIPVGTRKKRKEKENKKKRRLKQETENESMRKEKKTLKEYLEQNKPGFLESADGRREVVNDSRAHRAELNKNKLEFYDRLCAENGERNFRRLFSGKEMKEITRRNYQKLPEVQQRLVDNRDRQIKQVNRLMADTFNRKLRESVLKGKQDVPVHVNVIQM